FRARALTFVPSPGKLELELVLRLGKEVRTHRMELKDGVYRASAAVAPGREGPAPLRLTATFPTGSVSGLGDDQIFQVGAREHMLREVKRLTSRPKARVQLHGWGGWLKGEVTGLERVPVRLGTTTVPLDLSKAAEVRLAPAGLEALSCTVVARQDGKEVARLSHSLEGEGAARPGEEAGALDIEPPAPEE